MKISTLSTLTILTSLANFIKADCVLSSDGNYYCDETKAIVYSNVGASGSYNDITSMNEQTGACSSSALAFSGDLAPLNEELSVHFRGPINLKQFGVYYPANKLQKRDTEECEEVVTKKGHQHKRDIAVEYVEVTATVFVNAAGETVTPVAAAEVEAAETTQTTEANQKSSQAPVQSNSATAVAAGSSESSPSSSESSSGAHSSKTSQSASSSGSSVATGDWERYSYFTPGSASNCVFMNHQGGTAGSGVWSSTFGNSISFAASNGVDGAGSSYALDDVTLKSGQEFMIFSGVECSGNDCGYFREGIPAYHGFGGDDKIFVFEFEMPSDTSGSGYNQDMPAVWLLNAKIPRTLQYGNADCSCWESGCGEMDLFEILSKGSDKLISHVHDKQDSGSQDYFKRPVGNTLKAAVIFNSSDKTVHIVEVSDDFGATLSQDTVNSWLKNAGSSAVLP